MQVVLKRNVLLVVMPYILKSNLSKRTRLRSYSAFPYGVLSMVTYLKKKAGNDLNLQVFDFNVIGDCDPMQYFCQKIIEFKPDIVGLSLMFDNSYKYLRKICEHIRQLNEKTLIVVGGTSATPSFETILAEQPDVDAICFYEGEVPLLKLATSPNMAEAVEKDASWITRRSVKAGVSPIKTSLVNLDEALDIDYSFVDIPKYAMGEGFSPFVSRDQHKRKQFFITTSRGCPFNCIFCMHSADTDKSMRYASIEAVVKHVKFLISNHGMNTLTLFDDQILFNKSRAKRLFRELAQFKLRIECPSGLSVAFMDEEMINLMRMAGMDTAGLAIESGSSYVLNKIIQKPLNLKQVKPVVELLRKYGFWVSGFFVFGIPGETDKHREETIKFIKDVGFDWSSINLAVPTRGSKLYRICSEKKFIDDKLKIDEIGMIDFIINTPEYSPTYMKKFSYLANLDVNFVNNSSMRNGRYSLAADAFREIINRYPDHAFAHYFLSKALEALGDFNLARAFMERYREILKEDDSWQEFVKHFDLK